MQRREYIHHVASSAAATLAGCINLQDANPSANHESSESVAQETCEQCEDYEQFKRDHTQSSTFSPSIREELRELVHPHNHSWEGNCRFNEIELPEDAPFTKADLRDSVDCEVLISHMAGVVNVDINFFPVEPVDLIDTTVEVSS